MKTRVYVTVLCSPERQGWINPALAEFLANMRLDRRFDIPPFRYLDGYNHVTQELARNAIASTFLDGTDCEVLLMVDNDIAPQYGERMVNLLELANLAADGARPIVASPCPIYRRPDLQFNVFRKVLETGLFRNVTGDEIRQAADSIVTVDVAGTGAMAIHRRVFEKLPYPFFEFHRTAEGAQPAGGEDSFFCQRAIIHGFTVSVPFTLLCDHLRTVHLLDIHLHDTLKRKVTENKTVEAVPET